MTLDAVEGRTDDETEIIAATARIKRTAASLESELPLKTVQDWVYRGVVPSPANQEKLNEVLAIGKSRHLKDK